MFCRFILFCFLLFPCGLVSGQEWEDLGPALGDVEDFAVSITEPDRAYGIINRTRVVRSLDGGRTWEFSESGLQGVTGLISVTIDPTDSQTVYLGVDPEFGADYQEPPIWKSTNGADSWQPLTEGLPYGEWGDSLYWSIKRLLIHPEDPQYLVADTGVAYLYRSNDGGAQWEFIRRHSEYGCEFINPALNWKRPNVIWLLERCPPSQLAQVEATGAVEELRLWKGIQRGAS